MRPDQHKQKKSSQYKKKHGIQSTSKSEKHPQSSHQTVTQHSPAESTSQDEIQKSFGKRKIQTNWDKYDDNDEKVKEIGEDYNVLMSYASESHSYLRLKEEKEWETQEDMDEVLAIDCDNIAKAFSQLSFCECYNFSPSDFDPNLLRILGETTSLPSEGVQGGVVQNVFVDQTAFDFRAPATKQDEINNIHVETDKMGSINAKLDEPSDLELVDGTIKTPTVIDNSKICGEDSTSAEDLEDDLDDLLSSAAVQDKPALTKTAKSTTTTSEAALAYDNTTKDTGDGAEEDLEDWLDTIIS